MPATAKYKKERARVTLFLRRKLNDQLREEAKQETERQGAFVSKTAWISEILEERSRAQEG